MPRNPLPFEPDEYAARLARTRAGMEKAGLDLLLASDPSNMAWLTGYDGWSFYVHQGVLVADEGEPVWWGRRMDGFGALRTTYLDEGSVAPYPDDFVQSTERHPMQHLGALVRERFPAARRIGVEMDNYYYSAAAHAALAAAVPEATLVDATGLVNWQRTVKSPRELEYMSRAARIVERMHETIRERLRPGVRKNDLVAEIMRTGITGTDEHGGDYPAIVPLLPTGEDASAAHLTWDDRRLERGTGTFFEIAGCHRRYHAPLCRTAYIGEPPRAMRVAEQAVLEGLEAGLDAARPGAPAGDVARALHGALARAGIERTGRCGYPVGISYPPDWGERTISFRESDQSVLEAGMTFHFMPGLWMDAWGLEITETILIEPEGPARPLANVPRELFVVP